MNKSATQVLKPPVPVNDSKPNDEATVVLEDANRWAPLKGFLAVGVWYSLTGWFLSLFGWLNWSGYLGSTVAGLVTLALLWPRRREAIHRSVTSFSIGWRRRVRKPLPALYLFVFCLSALGGLLYAPTNFDALTYRVPQMLHWLDVGRWHWIATSNPHLNITGAGYGWLMAPMLALTKSDRGFFLPSIVAFAFLPGLFFSVARGCGVRRRVAWYWMWIVPTGYCFSTQAGSIANDLLPSGYLLAAVALAFHARRSNSVSDVWFSILAAALATGVKIVVLPLGLPWLVAIAPSWRLLLRKPVASILVIVAALAISFLPTAILNARKTGDWAGDPGNVTKMRLTDPLFGIVGNVLEIAAVNLAPPILPAAEAINERFARFEESPAGEAIRLRFPRFELQWLEMTTEDGAGIGLGIFILAGVSLVATAALRKPSGENSGNWFGWAITIASIVAAAAFAVKMGSEAAPRLFAPYYPFLLLPLLLLSAQEPLTRRRWWRGLSWLCAASIVPVLVLTPARPLLPAQSATELLAERYPNNPFLRRAQLVYSTFAQRHDNLAPLKRFFPAGIRTIGFVPTGNDLEVSLWRPFGSHRVVEILYPSSSDPVVRALVGSVVVCTPRGLREHFQMSAEDFCTAVGGRVIGEETLTLKAAIGPEKWYVIGL